MNAPLSRLLSTLALVMCLVFFVVGSSVKAQTQPSVLVLVGESVDYPWFKKVNQAISDAFYERYPHGQLKFDYLDLANVPESAVDDFRRVLFQKYKDTQFDIVIFDTDTTFNMVEKTARFKPESAYFVIKYSNALTPQLTAPHIYPLNVLNNYQLLIAQAHAITKAKHILLVGHSHKVLDIPTLKDIQNEIGDTNQAYKIEAFEFSTLNLLKARLNALNTKTAIIVTPFLGSSVFQKWLPAVTAEQIAKEVKVPVFVHWETMLNNHVLGGYVISASALANELVNGIQSYADGKSPILDSNNLYRTLYNVSTLESFDMDVRSLPFQTTLYNQAPSRFDVFFTEIVAVSIVLSVLLFASALLISWNNLLRKQQLKLYKSEIDVAQLHERVKIATSTSNIGIWEYDIASQTLEWDDAMFVHHEQDKKRFVPTTENWLKLVMSDDTNEIETNFLFAVHKGTHLHQDYRIESSMGTRYLSMSADAVLDMGDRPMRLVGTVKDISIQIKRELKVQKEKEKAELANRVKTNFIANMGYEIRSPMNAIIGASEVLGQTTLNDKQSEYLALINGSASSLLYVVNDILDLAKLESGKLNVEKYSFHTQDLIERAVSRHKLAINNKQLEVKLHIADNIPKFVISDPMRIRQILFNVIDNAIKFTETGHIKVDARFEQKTERGSEHTLQGTLLFSIQDTGIGISADAYERIFEKFAQSDPDTFKKYGGTGLGLNVSRQLAELLGGSLTVESQPNSGSMFTLAVPVKVAEDQSLVPQIKTIYGVPNLISKRVLVVDDLEINRLIIAQMLSDTNIDIIFAENGSQALAIFESQAIDLILLDIVMPIIDGLEVTRRVRKTHTAVNPSTIPIVSLTAQAAPQDIQMCLDAGVNAYLSKPVSRAELFETIDKVLSD